MKRRRPTIARAKEIAAAKLAQQQVDKARLKWLCRTCQAICSADDPFCSSECRGSRTAVGPWRKADV